MKKHLLDYQPFTVFLFCFLLIAWPFSMQAQAPALHQKIRLKLSHAKLEKVFQELEDKTRIPFSYSPESLPKDARITFHCKNLPLDKALSKILKNTGLTFEVVGQQIVIYSSKPAPQKTTVTFSGYVIDAESGEKLLHASVQDLVSGHGSITNNYGFFSLELPADSAAIRVAYVTYQSDTLHFKLHKSSQQTIGLYQNYSLEEVSIQAGEIDRIDLTTQMSRHAIPIEQIEQMPALLGEVDVVKAMQLLPGVLAGQEGSSGLYVRGGGPDQNLVLLDGVPLYYVSHLGGLFSIFNAQALNSVEIIKGGFPARYGGRLSSVLDVHMKEGNTQKLEGAGSVGLLATTLSIQGPIIKDKTSFILSGRRTYFDLFSNPLVKLLTDGTSLFGYHFYDLNLKLNHRFSDKDRIYLSTYMGSDRSRVAFEEEIHNVPEKLSNRFDAKLAWGNRLVSGRWNHLWSDKLFSNVTAIYGKYFYSNHFTAEREVPSGPPNRQNFFLKRAYDSGIEDKGLKIDFDFYPSHNHKLTFGANGLLHTFQPGFSLYLLQHPDSLPEREVQGDSAQISSMEAYVYLEDHWHISDRVSLKAGLHAATYRVKGTSYHSLQPRVQFRAQVATRTAFKAAYSSMTQFIHLLTHTGTGLPSDIWVPATDEVPPQQSQQVSLGLAHTLPKGIWQCTLEGYYKNMTGLIAYRRGQGFYETLGDWEKEIEKGGKGAAYGLEFFLQKKRGKTTGWIGYSLGWNFREFEGINGGKPFPYRYDRRHDIKVVISHKVNSKVQLSGSWVLGSGNAITVPEGRHNSLVTDVLAHYSPFSLGGDIVVLGEERNNLRMRTYHRLDLSATFQKETKWGKSSWKMGIYNAYNRKNPFFYFVGLDLDAEQPTTALKQLSLFTLIPSISYSFEF